MTAFAEDKLLPSERFAVLGKDAIGQIEASCESVSATESNCILSGVRIDRKRDGKCAVSSEISRVSFTLQNGRWTNVDGPGGMCGTTVIQEIDTSKFLFKVAINDKSAGACSQLHDFEIIYTRTSWLAPTQPLSCASFEFVPELSIESPY